MNKKAVKYPKGDEEIICFWNLMLIVLKELGPEKLEIWEFDTVVEKALKLAPTKNWSADSTYKKLPSMVVHVARTALPINDILFLHQKLHIELEPYDKDKLEKREKISILTDRKGRVVEWKQNEQKGVENKEKVEREETEMLEKEKKKEDGAEEKKTDNEETKEMPRELFTSEQDRMMVLHAYSKIQHSLEFGIPAPKLASPGAWEELANEPAMKKKSPGSMETRFRKYLKQKIYILENLDPEVLLSIGQALEVEMSEALKKAFESKYKTRITLKNGLIVDWQKADDK